MSYIEAKKICHNFGAHSEYDHYFELAVTPCYIYCDNCGSCDHFYDLFRVKCYKMTIKEYYCCCKECYKSLSKYYDLIKKEEPIRLYDSIKNDESIKSNTCRKCKNVVNPDDAVTVFEYYSYNVCNKCARENNIKNTTFYNVREDDKDNKKFSCEICSESKKIRWTSSTPCAGRVDYDLRYGINNYVLPKTIYNKKNKKSNNVINGIFYPIFNDSAIPKKAETLGKVETSKKVTRKKYRVEKPPRKKRVAVYDDEGFCTYVYK